MGRIMATVDLENPAEPRGHKKMVALVDTGASRLTLPLAWKGQLGSFEMEETIEVQIATQEVAPGIICGNAKIRVEGFQVIYSKVIFLDMRPEKGEYEPLLGYITLEECGAAVDVIGHRWIPAKYMMQSFVGWIAAFSSPALDRSGGRRRANLSVVSSAF